MLEYAWNVSPQNYVKCDPCVATAPAAQDLVQAGVWWINRDWNNYDDVYDKDEDYSANVFFTRLHVRYNRHSFPQDLVFQTTPNTENYQARYIITHPATGDFNCDAGKKYLKGLKERRQDELQTLAWLTGKNYQDWDLIGDADQKETIPVNDSYQVLAQNISSKNGATKNFNAGLMVSALAMLGFASFAIRKRK